MNGKEFFKDEEQLKVRLEEEAEKWFDQRINCGGYALELDPISANLSSARSLTVKS